MRDSFGSRIFDVFNYILLGLIGFITLYPFWDILQISLSDPPMVFSLGRMDLLKWFKTASPEMYFLVLSKNEIQLGYLNSIIQTALSTAIALVTCSLAAYPLSKKRLMGKKYIMVYITITMFFSGGMIPAYLLIKNLGMYNTIWAIILPGAFSAWNMIMMRTFFQGIPDEMEEAAQIEGANDIFILFRIYLPLSKALYGTMALFFAVSFWNSWFNALIYLKDENLLPLQIVLKNLLMGNAKLAMLTKFQSSDYYRGIGIETESVQKIFRSSVMIISILPLVIIYPFVQKYFVKGVMIGSIKG